MTRAMQLILVVLTFWFVAALTALAIYNIVKATVIRRRSRISLAALIAELEAVS